MASTARNTLCRCVCAAVARPSGSRKVASPSTVRHASKLYGPPADIAGSKRSGARKRPSLDHDPEHVRIRMILEAGKPLTVTDRQLLDQMRGGPPTAAEDRPPNRPRGDTASRDDAASDGGPGSAPSSSPAAESERAGLDTLQKLVGAAQQGAETSRAARIRAASAADPFGLLKPSGSGPDPSSTTTTTAAAAAPSILRERTPPLEDPLLVQFVGLTTKHGLKQRARRLATDVLELIRRMTNREPMPIFRTAVERAMPMVGLRSIRVTAMKKAAVPTALRERQRVRLAINAILANADRTKPGRQRAERIAAEMLQICIASAPKDSAVLDRKSELHRSAVMARSNVPGARGARRPRAN